MEHLYFENCEIETEDTVIRPSADGIDWAIRLLLVAVVVLGIWHKLQPQPVLPRPESRQALEYFCNLKLTPEVKP